MIIAKYDATRQYDAILSRVCKDIYSKLNITEDDFLLACCGDPGTGKSMLMLHFMVEYLGNKASCDLFGLTRADFALALKKSKEMPLPRFCGNDEANISKRDALSKYNKAVIDLYLSIRGLRIFHWWNNPSLDMIDKHFIEERIKGVIFIASKDIDRPRIYYYFRKKDLLKIWEKYGNVKINLLKRVCGEYAYYRGWFKDYKGELLEKYKSKKENRMEEKVDTFFDNYGVEDSVENIKRTKLAKNLNLSRPTITNYTNKMMELGLLKPEHIIVRSTGHTFYKKEAIPIFEEYIRNKKNKGKNVEVEKGLE